MLSFLSLAAKTNLYEPGMGEPMFVYSPEAKNRGHHSQALVSSVDLLPTALDWAGVHYPSYSLNGKHVKNKILLNYK